MVTAGKCVFFADRSLAGSLWQRSGSRGYSDRADDPLARCVVGNDAGHERLRRYGVPGQVKQNRSVAKLDFVIGHAAPPQPMVTVFPPCGLSA